MKPLLGEQLTETVRLDGMYVADGCESVHFYFCMGMFFFFKKGSTIKPKQKSEKKKLTDDFLKMP